MAAAKSSVEHPKGGFGADGLQGFGGTSCGVSGGVEGGIDGGVEGFAGAMDGGFLGGENTGENLEQQQHAGLDYDDPESLLRRICNLNRMSACRPKSLAVRQARIISPETSSIAGSTVPSPLNVAQHVHKPVSTGARRSCSSKGRQMWPSVRGLRSWSHRRAILEADFQAFINQDAGGE